MSGELRLRVAMVWSQAVQAEHLLTEPRPVVLGYGAEALFPLPESEALRGDVTLLTPTEHGVTLHLPVDAGGAVWLAGERHDVRSLRARAPSVELARGDYGVLSFGAASYFFQQVRTPEPARRALGSLDWEAALSLGLSVFLHGLAAGLMVLASRAFPFEPTLEVKPELRARVAAMEPAPRATEPLAPNEETKPADLAKPNRRPRRADPRERQRTKPATQAAPASEGEVAADKVRGMGLLGALSGSDGLKGALASDSVGALLGGLGAARPSAGTSGGRALRGAGGGDQGSLLGGGPIGTGSGGGRAGAGGGGAKGTGKSSGGKGAGKGELKVSLTPGAPQVSGFLSPEQINRVVRANQAALRYCYETEVQRQRGLRGKVVLQWRVDRAGAVPDARVAQTTLKSAAVEGCMLRQVKKWRFPKPDGGEVAVVYPFLFGVGE